MEPEDSPDEDGPLFAYLPPDDRLWRHPSEVRTGPAGDTAVLAGPVPRPVLRTWSVAVLAGMVGALVASGVSVAVGGFEPPRTTVLAPVTKMITPDTLALASVGASADWSSIVDAVSPSIASLTAMSPEGSRDGSAVVYAVDQRHTYLLTDAGLVDQGGAISVTFNGGSPVRGYLMRTDAKTGLAMVWVAGAIGTPPLFGSIGNLHEADQVMAVGARPTGVSPPLGASVSSLDRTVVDPTTSVALAGLIAIGATVPSGDAGGALVDDHGSVVGIATSATSADSDDSELSFVVPMDVAEHVAAQMMQPHVVTHPWLGITDSTDLDSATAARMGVGGGAQVISVAGGSPLALADVRPDDVVVALDGRPVTSSGELTALLEGYAPGAMASVSFRHLAQPVTATVRVAEQPADIDSP